MVFIGNGIHGLENYAESKTYFRRCIEAEPEDFQVLYNLLFCLEYLKAHDEAIEILNGILETNPYNKCLAGN